jgi:hypothetical protein
VLIQVVNRLKKMQDVPEQKRTIAANGFLNLLMRLRRVLLQDCAFLQQRQPDHLLLRHEIFQSDAYKSYAERVVQRSRTVQAPMDVQFQQVMPQLHSKMDTMSGVLELGMKDIHSTIDNHLADFREEMQPTLSDIGNVQLKQAEHQRRIGSAIGLLAQGLQLITEGTFETRLRMPNAEADTSNVSLGDQQSATTVNTMSMLDQIVKDTNDVVAQSSVSPGQGIQTQQGQTTSSSERVPSGGVLGGAVSVFTIKTNHTTVAALWQEWNDGVLGRQSIKEMLKADLKKSEGQRKLCSRRKIVVDEVKRLAKDRTEPPEEIVKTLDVFMRHNKLSMTKLQDLIRKRTSEGKTMALWLEE